MLLFKYSKRSKIVGVTTIHENRITNEYSRNSQKGIHSVFTAIVPGISHTQTGGAMFNIRLINQALCCYWFDPTPWRLHSLYNCTHCGQYIGHIWYPSSLTMIITTLASKVDLSSSTQLDRMELVQLVLKLSSFSFQLTDLISTTFKAKFYSIKLKNELVTLGF